MKGKLKEEFEKIRGKREPYVKSHIYIKRYGTAGKQVYGSL